MSSSNCFRNTFMIYGIKRGVIMNVRQALMLIEAIPEKIWNQLSLSENAAIELIVEKAKLQIPKEHHHTAVFEMNDKIRVSVCPSCLCLNYTHKDEFPDYCNKCDQKIDWK